MSVSSSKYKLQANVHRVSGKLISVQLNPRESGESRLVKTGAGCCYAVPSIRSTDGCRPTDGEESESSRGRTVEMMESLALYVPVSFSHNFLTLKTFFIVNIVML